MRDGSKRGERSVEVMKRGRRGFKGWTFLGRFWSQEDTFGCEVGAVIGPTQLNFRTRASRLRSEIQDKVFVQNAIMTHRST